MAKSISAKTSGAFQRTLPGWDREISDIQKGRHGLKTALWKNTKRLPNEALVNLEKKLKIALPQSYRDFLIVSNGQFQLSNALEAEFTGSAFHSVDKVDFFSATSPQLYRGWVRAYDGTDIPDDVYFIYGKDQSAPALRAKYLDSAVEVSEFYAGVKEFILLNPQVKTAHSEFEAWWLSPRHPGAVRYKTFADLMISFYYIDTHGGVWYPGLQQIESSCAGHLLGKYQ